MAHKTRKIHQNMHIPPTELLLLCKYEKKTHTSHMKGEGKKARKVVIQSKRNFYNPIDALDLYLTASSMNSLECVA